MPCSIAPFSAQLTSLSLIDDSFMLHFNMRLAFLPHTPSHTLTHFDTGNDLDVPLLEALLDHAPALTHLTVEGFNLRSESFKDRRWRVERIVTRTEGDLGGIALLPSRESGRVRIDPAHEEDDALYVLGPQVGGGLANTSRYSMYACWQH